MKINTAEKRVYLGFLDLEKRFDQIQYEKLKNILKRGIDTKIIKMIRNEHK